MRWTRARPSTNVEDRRGWAPLAIGGGLGAVVLAVLALILGVDPRAVLPGDRAAPRTAPADDEGARFARAILGSTEDVWTELFRARGARYTPPTLVLFTGAVESGCGAAGAAVGPFYCPRDANVYLDLGFFDDLARLGAPGDFARAYVVAHEVGHHVQNLLGVTERARAAQETASSRAAANAVSVRVELMADCLAGVWAHHAQRQLQWLEPGEARQALDAAAAIGDDRLQRRAQGTVVPESFTHGTSEQRVRWFRRGFDRGDPTACDTFAAS